MMESVDYLELAAYKPAQTNVTILFFIGAARVARLFIYRSIVHLVFELLSESTINNLTEIQMQTCR